MFEFPWLPPEINWEIEQYIIADYKRKHIDKMWYVLAQLKRAINHNNGGPTEVLRWQYWKRWHEPQFFPRDTFNKLSKFMNLPVNGETEIHYDTAVRMYETLEQLKKSLSFIYTRRRLNRAAEQRASYLIKSHPEYRPEPLKRKANRDCTCHQKGSLDFYCSNEFAPNHAPFVRAWHREWFAKRQGICSNKRTRFK